jgi:hypothetical protein
MKKEEVLEDADPKPKKFKQIFTLRDVIKQNYHSRVKAEIPVEPTDHTYIGKYQRAVTTVLGALSRKELKEAQEIVDAWNKQGAPRDHQLK